MTNFVKCVHILLTHFLMNFHIKMHIRTQSMYIEAYIGGSLLELPSGP